MMDNVIEVYCSQCGRKNSLPVINSFQDTTIVCSECGTSIYWFSCPQCETGYYDIKSDASCPECAPEAGAPISRHSQQGRKNINPLRIFSRPCPWCSHDIYFFFLSKNLVKCPKCKRYSGMTGLIRGVSIAIVSVILTASLVDIFQLRNLAAQYMGKGPGKLVLAVVVISGFLMILSKTIKLEKLK